MKKVFFNALFIVFCACLFSSQDVNAQDHIRYQEYGAWVGGSNYLGDLNPNYNFSQTRPAFGAFYKYSIGPYIAFRGGLNYGKIQFRDELNASIFPEQRNLSFESNIFEIATNAEFNFLRYIPGNKTYFASPYLTIGFAVTFFNPKAVFNGQMYELQELGTEGQQNNAYTGRNPYSTVTPSIPVGLGFKYWLHSRWNLGVEAGYRFTFTDYLDDVSSTYVLEDYLGSASIAAALADRSEEGGFDIGDSGRQRVGRQRGDSVSKDSYIFMGIFVTYTIFQGNCPKK